MTGSTAMSFGGALCTRCGQGFAPKEEMVNSNGEIWHTKCFVESGRAANPALGVGAANHNNLVMGIESLDMTGMEEGSVGLQENRFPVEDDDMQSETGTALESIQGDFEPEGELQWQDSGLQGRIVGVQEDEELVEVVEPPLEAKVAEDRRGEDVDIILGLKETPESSYVEKSTKSGLKRQSSLQEARKRFQDIEEDAKNQSDLRALDNGAGVPDSYDTAVPDSSYKYESTEVDTSVIRKKKSPETRNGHPTPVIEQTEHVTQDIEPIYQPYKRPEPPPRKSSRNIMQHDPSYQTSFRQTERQEFETEEVPYKFPTNMELNDLTATNGRPPTEYVNGPPGLKSDTQLDYDGSTLRAQSGGQQRSVMNSYRPLPDPPTKGYPLPERPLPQFGSKMFCCKCEDVLELDSPIVNYNGNVWHPGCFVCVQCFQPFPEGIFYEFEGRKYCEHDFHMLFAPCCGACGEFVVGRVIKAMNSNWHPQCFLCEICNVPLADAGFYKNAGRALCKECNNREKAAGMGKYVCHKCHSIIEEGHIKFKGEAYHPYHFNCTNCNVELNADGREKNGELFCLRCHDKMGIPICGACRRPIEERVVHAMGKTWHVEHFVCAKCEKPFLGARHYEKRGLAYCEIHYHQLFGNMCFLCNNVIAGDVFSALNKAWCTNHFACYLCDKKLNQKNKFFEFDLKPVCKMCYEHFPSELKKRMKKAYENSPKK